VTKQIQTCLRCTKFSESLEIFSESSDVSKISEAAPLAQVKATRYVVEAGAIISWLKAAYNALNGLHGCSRGQTRQIDRPRFRSQSGKSQFAKQR
jgi:hypothetical protein